MLGLPLLICQMKVIAVYPFPAHCILFFKYLFIWLCWVLVVAHGILFAASLIAACGIYFPDQGLNPSLLQWEHGILATGPPRRSLSPLSHLQGYRAIKRGDRQERRVKICAECCLTSRLERSTFSKAGILSCSIRDRKRKWFHVCRKH